LLLYSALGLCALLNAATFVVIWKVGRHLDAPVMVQAAAVCWFVLSPTYMTGMENSLHAFLWWWLAYRSLRLMTAAREDAPIGRDVIQCTVLACAVVWTRVDSSVLVIPLVLVLALDLLRTRWNDKAELVRAGMVSSAIAVCGAFVLFGSFYWMGGSLLPVSASVKMDVFAWNADDALTVAATALNAPLADVPSRLFEALPAGAPRYGSLAMLVTAALIAGKWWRDSARASDRLRNLTWIIAALTLGGTCQVVFLGGLGEYATYGFWYLSPLLMLTILVVSTSAAIVVRELSRTVRGGTVTRAMVLVATIGLVMAGVVEAAGLGTISRALELSGPGASELSVRRFELAGRLRRESPRDTIFAAWNAGQLAYFSERRVVNLDGLVNSTEYYQEMRPRRNRHGDVSMERPERLGPYLRGLGVDYVVDYEELTPGDFGLRPVRDGALVRTVTSLGFWICAPAVGPDLPHQ
jgi:hypothetical protein